MKGWFAVARGITAHHLFRGNPERLAVWLWLLDNAAWKDTTHDVSGRTIQVPRGSVCASTRHIAEAVGVGHQVVRTALRRFQSEHMVNTAATHGKTLITLRNYCKYQDHEGRANTAPNTALTQQQHSANTQKEQGNKGTSIKEEAKASLSSGDDAKAETERAIAMFNDTAGAQGWPQVRVLSKQRLSALKGRLREVGGLDGWQDALARAAASDHLNGKNDRGWTCNFDFLTRQSSFAKLMEGNYDNRQPARRSKGDERLAAAYRAAEQFERERSMGSGAGRNASEPLLPAGPAFRIVSGGDG